MHKKKSKAMISVLNDEDSDGNQEEDDNNVNLIVFTSSLIYTNNSTVRKTTESVVIDFTENSVAIDVIHCSLETYSNSGPKSKTVEEVR